MACGRRATWLSALLPTLVAAVVFALYYQAQPHWLADPDAQDYAQLGRQILRRVTGIKPLLQGIERRGEARVPLCGHLFTRLLIRFWQKSSTKFNVQAMRR